MPCRVFIADDVEGIRLLWQEFLEEHPEIEVVGQAGDGLAAVSGVHETAPDVLVLDLSMPKMDGLEVIRVLKAEIPDVRIVVASGFAAGRMAPLALDLGATAYLEKGITADALRDTVLEAFTTVP